MQAPELSRQVAKMLFRPQLSEYILTPQERDMLVLKQNVFNRITADFSLDTAKEASHAHSARFPDDSALTYGEVGTISSEFLSLGEVFQSIKTRHGGFSRGVFYDLGSVVVIQGSGKGVIAAALLHPFVECKGIELVPGLHSISAQMKAVYDRDFPLDCQARPDLFLAEPAVSFTLGSFFDVQTIQIPWSDVTVFFANSTCFSRDMLQRIADSPVDLGTLGITLTKPLPGNNWRLLENYKKEMSWGQATVFVQRRIDQEEENRVGKEVESYL